MGVLSVGLEPALDAQGPMSVGLEQVWVELEPMLDAPEKVMIG